VVTALILAAALVASSAPEPASNVSQTQTSDLLTDPIWKKLPPADELWKFYPERAARLGISGFSVIICKVDESGKLTKCKVFGEDPRNENFGLALAKVATLLMQVGDTSIGGEKTVGRAVKVGARFTAAKSIDPRAMKIELVTVQQ
jgi:hypothetical protein